MADVKDAVALITDPKHISDAGRARPEKQRAVKQQPVLAKLRGSGAGKAEARQLALAAIEEIGGEVEEQTKRGGQTGAAVRFQADEIWWIPAERIRWPESV